MENGKCYELSAAANIALNCRKSAQNGQGKACSCKENSSQWNAIKSYTTFPYCATHPFSLRTCAKHAQRTWHFYDIFRNGKRTIPSPWSQPQPRSQQPAQSNCHHPCRPSPHNNENKAEKTKLLKNKINVIFMSFHRYFLVPHSIACPTSPHSPFDTWPRNILVDRHFCSCVIIVSRDPLQPRARRFPGIYEPAAWYDSGITRLRIRQRYTSVPGGAGHALLKNFWIWEA